MFCCGSNRHSTATHFSASDVGACDRAWSSFLPLSFNLRLFATHFSVNTRILQHHVKPSLYATHAAPYFPGRLLTSVRHHPDAADAERSVAWDHRCP
jgi:hypothetical protein